MQGVGEDDTYASKVAKAYELFVNQDESLQEEKKAAGTTINGTSISELIKDGNYQNLYGKKVTYQGKTFSVFYYSAEDDDEFGEKGTLFLKADQSDKITVGNYYGRWYGNNYSLTDTVVRQMNPDWAKKRGNSELDWNANERAAAYLCDPTVEKWSNYITQNPNEVNWIIGAPSAEMYMKSYGQYIGNNNYEAKYLVEEAPGYKYKITENTEDYQYDIEYAMGEENEMYIKTGEDWWLASPSAYGDGYLCVVHGIER